MMTPPTKAELESAEDLLKELQRKTDKERRAATDRIRNRMKALGGLGRWVNTQQK